MAAYRFYIEDSEFGRVRVRTNKKARRFIFRADRDGLMLTCSQRAREHDIHEAIGKIRPRLRRLLEVEKDRSEEKPTPEMLHGLVSKAVQTLPQRLEELAREHGFSYNKVTVRVTYSRWGSCSATHNISLSAFIIILPEHLQDYVMLHELCHTREMNHSPKFWELLDKHVEGRNMLYRQEMRNYKITSLHP